MSTDQLLLMEIHQNQQRALEEEMTQYTQEDLENDWEFKFIRSATASFRKPEVLKELIEEEAKFGWIMLEKFDDGRIRFKRRRSSRDRDHRFIEQGEDPYRTIYGKSSQKVALQALLFGFGFVVVVVGIVFLISSLT